MKKKSSGKFKTSFDSVRQDRSYLNSALKYTQIWVNMMQKHVKNGTNKVQFDSKRWTCLRGYSTNFDSQQFPQFSSNAFQFKHELRVRILGIPNLLLRGFEIHEQVPIMSQETCEMVISRDCIYQWWSSKQIMK